MIDHPSPPGHVGDTLGLEGEGCYILCRVEGCPRTIADDGEHAQGAACGLSRLGYFKNAGHRGLEHPLCGSTLTLDHWIETGMLVGYD